MSRGRSSFESCWGVPNQISCASCLDSAIADWKTSRGANLERESIKSELIRRWTMDERLHIISIEVAR